MTTQEPAESFTEWGVRWPSGYVVVRSTEEAARTLLRAIRPAEKPELVSHIVTQTAWTAVDLDAEAPIDMGYLSLAPDLQREIEGGVRDV